MSDQVTLTIDGVELSVPQGTLVVDAAKRIGNDIPVFCYHPKMEPVGMCRMCLVEIGVPMRSRETGQLLTNEDGSPKINFGRGLQTGCTVPVSEGMVVRTTTDVVDKAREDVVEFLLTSHPLDCPICDKGGECPLQNLTMAHGKGTSRMTFSDKLKLDKHVPLGELIYLDRERCIQCGRCVRFQDEIVADPVIHFHNRGRSIEIVTMSDPGFDSYWSGNTTDICPVGALTTSDFRFGARPWELTPGASLCNHCPVGCNTTLSTRREAKSGGRTVIKRVMPRQNESVNEIWICDKGRFVHHYAESPERLTQPLVRKGGELVEVEWDEALDLVASKLQQAETAVAGLASGRLSNEDLFSFQKLFRQGLKSNNIDLAHRRLSGGDVVAGVGISSGSNLKDLGAGDAILVVAADLHEEAPLWWLRVKQATERGAALILLNARSTRLDKYARQVITYRPGAAVNMVRQLVNTAKVEIEAGDDDPVNAAAAVLAEANNVVAFYGYEGLTLPETEAVARLLGNLFLIQNGATRAGQPNNGLIPVWPQGNTQGAWDMGVHPALGPGYKRLPEAGLDAAAIYAGAADGSLQVLYIVAADPVGDGLLAGEDKPDFLVVEELFLTETAAIADVVLPAQSWAEREGSYTNGERRIQRYYPAIQPMGQSRADWQILTQIGERLGLGKSPFAASLLFRDVAKAVPQYKGIDYRTLAAVVKQWPDVGGDDLYYGGNAYENSAGLGQQWPVAAETEEVAHFDVPDVAIKVADEWVVMQTAALYTPGTLVDQSDLILAERKAAPLLALHTADATDLGIVDGDPVQVSVAGKTAAATARVNDLVTPGVGLLRGVGQPLIVGTAVATIEKIEAREKERV